MKRLLFTIACVFALSSCDRHFITSPVYRETVEKDFTEKINTFDGRISEKDILSSCSGREEQEAMKFLYAYMPAGDMSDYDSRLYLDGVRTAFRAAEEMPWGETVPEDLFRHFVLPLRVNNENLDSSRTVFYEELKDRVMGLSMYDAILEVNRWCHEKVVYTPTDARTSSPLATVKTAFGRCGEESVFTVAALRAVGIPARQVYTPRWAHTDNNHAWVEAWADGQWHYLGACEPEMKLDVAWFSSTALRSMLMHSKVFGKYEGDEDIIARTECYTEINVTANYAPVGRVHVLVNDAAGHKVDSARVEYKIYNYSEFYSAITDYTSPDGFSTATFGRGDILVWCSKDGKFGFSKVTVDSDHVNIVITLDKNSDYTGSELIDIVPPPPGKAPVRLTAAEIDSNAVLLAREDSIREAYTSTFADLPYCIALFGPEKGESYAPYLIKARGNKDEIAAYLTRSAEYGDNALLLLDLINEKDLRDTPAGTLLDHISNYSPDPAGDAALYAEYVLNPRISTEMLTPYKSFFRKEASEGAFGDTVDIDALIEFAGRIKPADLYNPQMIPMTPIGVYRLMAADRMSRDIFFTALCRSFGIPARIDAVSGKLQYYSSEGWADVNLGQQEGSAVSIPPQGSIDLRYESNGIIDDPKYEIGFTLAKIEDGTLRTLNFTGKEGIEGLNTYRGLFASPLETDCGQYMLTTGTRMASGKVLAGIDIFTVREGETTEVEMHLRADTNDLQVIGELNPEAAFTPASDTAATTILNTTGRGFFVIGFLKANHEPSNHAVREIFASTPPVPVILFYGTPEEYQKHLSDTFSETPENVTIGIDDRDGILGRICTELKIENAEYPLFIIADSFGKIVYLSEGYNIGTAEHIGSALKKI